VVAQLGKRTDKRSISSQQRWVAGVMESCPLEGLRSE